MDKEVSVFFRDLAKVAVPDSMPQNTPEHERQVPVDFHPSNFIQERINILSGLIKKRGINSLEMDRVVTGRAMYKMCFIHI